MYENEEIIFFLFETTEISFGSTKWKFLPGKNRENWFAPPPPPNISSSVTAQVAQSIWLSGQKQYAAGVNHEGGNLTLKSSHNVSELTETI